MGFEDKQLVFLVVQISGFHSLLGYNMNELRLKVSWLPFRVSELG